jgi:hypothetical protein
VFHERGADHFEKVEDIPVQKLVHTHRVYAPEQEEDGEPVARMVIHEPVVRKPPK